MTRTRKDLGIKTGEYLSPNKDIRYDMISSMVGISGEFTKGRSYKILDHFLEIEGLGSFEYFQVIDDKGSHVNIMRDDQIYSYVNAYDHGHQDRGHQDHGQFNAFANASPSNSQPSLIDIKDVVSSVGWIYGLFTVKEEDYDPDPATSLLQLLKRVGIGAAVFSALLGITILLQKYPNNIFINLIFSFVCMGGFFAVLSFTKVQLYSYLRYTRSQSHIKEEKKESREHDKAA